MHVEKKRIFVGNLPPSVDEGDVKDQFSQYGNVVSVEIKQRKESANQNVSSVFAFVNIETDDKSLNKCFRDISNYDWQGHYVKLELAKESFLERLKREREEAQAKSTNTNNKPIAQPVTTPQSSLPKVNNVAKKKIYQSSSSSESSESSEEDEPKQATKKPEVVANGEVKDKKNIKENADEPTLVVKNNKHRLSVNGKFKIESVCDKPVHIITPKNNKSEVKDPKSIQAEEKRLKSLSQMKNSYQQQKSAIKSALSSIDKKPRNKIVFDDDYDFNHVENSNKRKARYELYNEKSKKSKLSLFNDDAEEDESINFEIKKQFEGRKGQKLLELQSRFTNDKRFTLDSRFLDDDAVDDDQNEGPENDERDKQFEILESVLGQKISKKPKGDVGNDRSRISMLRFDPSKPEHSKFEIKEHSKDDTSEKKKKRREIKDMEEDKNQENEKPSIEVSKEKFYKVTDNLKQSLQEKPSFSLLSMFGRAEEKDETEDLQEMSQEIRQSKQFDTGQNPFKYDSSDTEDEEEDKSSKKKKEKVLQIDKQESIRSWGENFFFRVDDDRLKEGLDFLKRLGNESKGDAFAETRRSLKQVIRAKVRNTERNNRPFRKKLGRNKMIKVKKAMRK